MKKIILPILLITSLIISCKSYTVPYDTALNNKTINTGLYVDTLPPVQINFNAILKYPIHGSAIEKAFNESDLRTIIYEEFKKNGEAISPKFKIASKENSDAALIIPKVKNAEKLDPKKCEYDFNTTAPMPGKDYIFTVKVENWGFSEGGFSIQGYVNLVAAIHDVKNSKKVWQMEIGREASFPALSLGYSDAKNPEVVRKILRDCVIGNIQAISANINGASK